MRRVRLTWIIPGMGAFLVGMTIVCAAAVGAAGPPPPLVAQAATVVLTPPTPAPTVPSANPLATAPSASSASGTSAATPSSTETVDTGSAAAPPEPLPVVAASSGPSRGQVIITLIGVIGALIVIPFTAFALIRLIATAGR